MAGLAISQEQGCDNNGCSQKFEGKGEVGGDREEEAAFEPLGQEVEVEVAERAKLVRQHTGR